MKVLIMTNIYLSVTLVTVLTPLGFMARLRGTLFRGCKQGYVKLCDLQTCDATFRPWPWAVAQALYPNAGPASLANKVIFGNRTFSVIRKMDKYFCREKYLHLLFYSVVFPVDIYQLTDID